jgi:hypothetical protein
LQEIWVPRAARKGPFDSDVSPSVPGIVVLMTVAPSLILAHGCVILQK